MEHLATLALGALVSILTALFGYKIRQYDQHLRDCNKRHETAAVLEARVSTTEREIKDVKRDVRWIGDCVTRIGTKLDVDLPDRP